MFAWTEIVLKVLYFSPHHSSPADVMIPGTPMEVSPSPQLLGVMSPASDIMPGDCGHGGVSSCDQHCLTLVYQTRVSGLVSETEAWLRVSSIREYLRGVPADPAPQQHHSAIRSDPAHVVAPLLQQVVSGHQWSIDECDTAPHGGECQVSSTDQSPIAGVSHVYTREVTSLALTRVQRWDHLDTAPHSSWSISTSYYQSCNLLLCRQQL